MKNIKLFDSYTAKTLGLLYEKFPLPCDFCYFDFVEAKDYEELITCNLNCFYAIQHLKNNDFLSYENIDQTHGSVEKAILTQKGLKVLRSESLGEQLNKALHCSKEIIIKSLVDKFIETSIKFF